MLFLKFLNLSYKVKTLFSYLPKRTQLELVDDMENYYNLCRFALLTKKGEDDGKTII